MSEFRYWFLSVCNQGAHCEITPPPLTEKPEEEEIVTMREVLSRIFRENTENSYVCSKKFSELNLDENTRDVVLSSSACLNFVSPYRVQAALLEMLSSKPHQNLLVQTPPRTGKTVAMVMSALSIVDPDQQCPQILFVVPTIELMYQIGRLFLAAQKSYSKQIRMTFAENHYVDGMIVYEQIVVGLPKRLNGMIHAYLLDASKLRLVVFEEADLLMSETNRYLYYCNRIHTKLPKTCCVVWLSSSGDFNLRKKANLILRNQINISVNIRYSLSSNTLHCVIACPRNVNKIDTIHMIANHTVKKIMIFCKNMSQTNFIVSELKKRGLVAVRFGSQNAEAREAKLSNFKNGNTRILVDHNTLSRGIDMGNLQVVILYETSLMKHRMPDYEAYVQRAGRCASKNSPAVVFTLTLPVAYAGIQATGAHYFTPLYNLLYNQETILIVKKLLQTINEM